MRYLKSLHTSDKQINPNNISSLSITNTFTLYDRINYLKWRGKRVELMIGLLYLTGLDFEWAEIYYRLSLASKIQLIKY
jgi:hypothetical protein